MRWNTSSFDGVELSELQGTEVKQEEREKRPDTDGTQTLQLKVGSTSLNYETTSAPILWMISLPLVYMHNMYMMSTLYKYIYMYS